MTVVWVDAGQGASGDMLLGALWDAGADAGAVRAAVRAAVPAEVEFAHETRQGFRVARAVVVPEREDLARSPERRWSDIRELLQRAPLAPPVRDGALAVFEALALAEAAVHGVDPATVHFHEVGGHDAIADIVGTVAALRDLGAERLVTTPVAVGFPHHEQGHQQGDRGQGDRQGAGDARASTEAPGPGQPHGTIPVPAPAVLQLATAGNVPVLAGSLPGEACTPTGMALLATLTDAWGPLPPVHLGTIGAGAGSRPTPGRFGALRVVVGRGTSPLAEAAGPERGVSLVTETNVDDLDPRLWPRVLARLLAAGADDAWLTPVLMKKGRPAHTLAVLSSPEATSAVHDVVLSETSAIGLRVHAVAKHALPRDTVATTVAGEQVRVKRAWLHGRVVNAQPEWEDVAAVAARTGRPAKEILARATAAAGELLGTAATEDVGGPAGGRGSAAGRGATPGPSTTPGQGTTPGPSTTPGPGTAAGRPNERTGHGVDERGRDRPPTPEHAR